VADNIVSIKAQYGFDNARCRSQPGRQRHQAVPTSTGMQITCGARP
jgi:hypothetical protein